MPISLSPIETTDGRAALVVAVQPEAVEVVALLRNIKAAFPKEWRAVHYEIAQPGKQTIVTPDAQEIEIKGADNANATSVVDEATANANSVGTTGEGAGNGTPQASVVGV